MSSQQGEDLTAVEELLRASRPAPDPTFVNELERHRFSASRERRPLLLGASAAAAVASAVFGLSLAGVGPLAPGDEGSGQARDDCKLVTVKKRVRVPVIVEGPNGEPQVRYRRRVVQQRVKRCP